MNALVQWFRVQRHRAYLYSVAGSAGALLQGYGLVSGSHLALILGLASTVLVAGTARANTSTQED